MTNEAARRPLVRVRGLYYPTNHTPEEIFQAIGRLRKEAADEIDRLIRFLDDTGGDLDGDAAIDDGPCDGDGTGKPDDTEPSLGWTLATDQSGRRFFGGADDLEDEHDGREPEIAEEDHEAEEDHLDPLTVFRARGRRKAPTLPRDGSDCVFVEITHTEKDGSPVVVRTLAAAEAREIISASNSVN